MTLGYDVLPAATRITQGYGCSDYSGEWYAPWCPTSYFHAGIDLAADDIRGKPVYATRDGVVVANQDPPHTIFVCPEMGGGVVSEPYLGSNAVILEIVENGQTVWLEHGHLSDAAVFAGAGVKAGQLLGHVGTQGASCGNHLHLEARIDGPWQGVDSQAAGIIDPTPFLMAKGAFMGSGSYLFIDGISITGVVAKTGKIGLASSTGGLGGLMSGTYLEIDPYGSSDVRDVWLGEDRGLDGSKRLLIFCDDGEGSVYGAPFELGTWKQLDNWGLVAGLKAYARVPMYQGQSGNAEGVTKAEVEAAFQAAEKELER